MLAIDSTLELELVRTESDFRRLEPEWDKLLAVSRGDGPFLRHGWLSGWWAAHRDGHELCVPCWRHSLTGQLLGALPLYITDKRRVVKARIARFIGEPGVGAAGLSALVRPEAEQPVLDAMRRTLASSAMPWDVADLRYMDPAHPFSSVVAATEQTYGDLGVERCPRIELPASWDEYLQRLSKNWRHQVARSLRQIEQQGMRYEVIGDAAALDKAAEDFFRLHESRMHTVIEPGYRVGVAERSFTRQMMRSLLDEGRLRLMFVTGESGRAAVLYQLRHGDTTYALQSGFDAVSAGNHAQRALWAFAVRHAIEEGCTVLDMMHGDHEYKQHWAPTETRHLVCARVYGASPVGRLIERRDQLKRAR